MEAFWNGILNALKEWPVITTLVVFALTVFARTVFWIFRQAVLFRTELVSKKEQKEFEKEIENNLRNYKEELAEVVLAAAMEVIKEKLKDFDEIKNLASDAKVTEAKLKLLIDDAIEKVNEVRSMSDNLRSLNAKVDRLEYGKDQAGIRRKE